GEEGRESLRPFPPGRGSTAPAGAAVRIPAEVRRGRRGYDPLEPGEGPGQRPREEGVDSILPLPSSSGVDVDRDAGEGHAVRSVGRLRPGRLWPDEDTHARTLSVFGPAPDRSLPMPSPGSFLGPSHSLLGPSRPSISARRLLLSGGLTKLWELACFRLV
ncbi:hypothetical protein THAOC_28635, partial [Thalassiosira oceanica]